MKFASILKIIVPIIVVLAAICSGVGLFYETPGEPYQMTNFRGETVTINNHGLYRYDTVNSMAQMQGNDVVTLFIAIPILIIASAFAWKGSLRGRLLLTGTLAFFLYTYLSMSMLTAFNQLFILYVIIFSISLFGFILCIRSFDVEKLVNHFSPKLPRKAFAIFLFAICAFILLAWLNRVITPIFTNSVPFLENTTTMVIQAMDLGLIVPLSFLAGYLLLKNNGWGYLLTSVVVMKAVTLGLGISAMVLNMMRTGTEDNPAVMYPFLVITVINLIFVYILSKNIVTPNLAEEN